MSIPENIFWGTVLNWRPIRTTAAIPLIPNPQAMGIAIATVTMKAASNVAIIKSHPLICEQHYVRGLTTLSLTLSSLSPG